MENFITELYDGPNRLGNLQVEPEENVQTDEKRPYVLHSEVEKAIKVTMDKKAVRDDNISGDVPRILGEDGLRMTQLINKLEGGQRMSLKLELLP